MAAKMSAGQRGKFAEKKVREYLEKVDQQLVHFDYERVSDARSAGGRGAKTVVGDFMFFTPELHGVIEVKEIGHDFRIPAKNITQLPKLRKRLLAGGRCYVVVYHTTTQLWRCIPAEELELRTTGSWDLRDFPTYESLEQALPIKILGG